MTPQDTHPLLEAARLIAPELAARCDEMEAARRLPFDLATKMAEAGFFRMVTPEAYGGFECTPGEIVETIEILAEANASAGWCAMIAGTTAMNAAYLPAEIASEIYGSPTAITGGVFAPMGRAEVDGDAYIVSGRWQWGSGTANCSWLCAGALIFEDGVLKTLPSGQPDARMMIFPASEANLLDTWNVMGLEGTGSGDFEVEAIRVPKARTVSLVSDKPNLDRPLYAFPPFGLLALGVSAVALGNAAGALKNFSELATVKKSQGSRRTLAQRNIVQLEYARQTASLRAARSYLLEEVERTWASANLHGKITVERRAALRMACTHMVRTCADICRILYDMGGGAALFRSNALQRRFRDAHAITQHIVTAPATWELTGRLLLGLETDDAMI
jgi:alkylation response protein AidB-like acyl-CoA dehydrogenase